MKALFFLIAFFAVVATVDAQRLTAITVTASEADTSKGAETDYIVIPNVGHFEGVADLDIQILCTQLGGTSDGTITIERSLDGTSYSQVLTTIDTDLIAANDSFTITNAAVCQFRLKTYWPYYRVKIVGTSADTTKFTTKYAFVK